MGSGSMILKSKRKILSDLEIISSIHGLLVPGQESVLYIIGSTLKKNSLVVEIGSFVGKSTACIALGANKNINLYAIDTFKGNEKDFCEGKQFEGKSFYKQFLKNMKKIDCDKIIHPVKGFSQEVGKAWNKKIDMLFVDGSHIYKDVKKDIELFLPWVKPAGLVVLHDVTKKFPGVYKVWNENVKNNLSISGKFYTLSFGYKKASFIVNLINKMKVKYILWLAKQIKYSY